jgi:phosphoglycolate phosphatase
VIRNVIFDWSGTLVDDLPAVLKATNYVMQQAKRPEMTLEQFRAEFCLPFTDFYDRHVPHVPLPRLESWFHHSFRQLQESVIELPHAREFLEFCRAKTLRTFVLSTVHPDYFKTQTAVTGFGKFLDHTYTGVRDKRKRIHAILKQHKLRPGETLFIGDMQHDIETARHGGIHSCAVLTGYNNLAQLRAAKPDLIVEHLRELRDILERCHLNITKAAQLRNPDFHNAGCLPTPTVGGLIFNDADQVLMILTHKWSNLWGIPGGKIKWGETSEAALCRELKEETNLDITDIRFVLVQDCIHSPEFYYDAHFVLLNYTCRAGGKLRVKLNDEGREFRWVTVAEALAMPLNQPTRILLEAVNGKRATAITRRKTKEKRHG